MASYRNYTVVVIGTTGTGKSTLCNVIAGMDPTKGKFPVSAGLDSCTYETTRHQVQWLGREQNLTLIDTPGLDDHREGRDTEHIANMVDKLKETRHINLFLIVFNGQCPRMDSRLKAMFKIFQGVFGDGFWQNTVIEFSRWGFDTKSENQRKREGISYKSQEDRLNNFFHKELGVKRRIPCVFVDACYDKDVHKECEAFARETEKLLQFIKTFPDYECKDFKKVMTENDSLKNDIKNSEKGRLEAVKQASIFQKEKVAAEKGRFDAEKRTEAAEFALTKAMKDLSELKSKLEDQSKELEDLRRETDRIRAEAKLEKERLNKEKNEWQSDLEEKFRKEYEDLQRESERRSAEAARANSQTKELYKELERLKNAMESRQQAYHSNLHMRDKQDEMYEKKLVELTESIKASEARTADAMHRVKLANERQREALEKAKWWPCCIL